MQVSQSVFIIMNKLIHSSDTGHSKDSQNNLMVAFLASINMLF